MHRDRNAVGSQNIIAPTSWYMRGKTWVEDPDADNSKPGAQLRERKGKQIKDDFLEAVLRSLTREFLQPDVRHATAAAVLYSCQASGES